MKDIMRRASGIVATLLAISLITSHAWAQRPAEGALETAKTW